MTLTYQDLVTYARDVHPAFDPKRIGDALLVRRINALVHELLREGTKVDADFALAEYGPLALAAGAWTTLPATVGQVRRVELTVSGETPGLYPDRRRGLTVLGMDSKTVVPLSGEAVIVLADATGVRAMLVGAADDWTGADLAGFYLYATPRPPDVGHAAAALSSYVDGLPDSAREVMVAELALFMAQRAKGFPDVAERIDLAWFVSEAQRQRAEFLRSIAAAKHRRFMWIPD
jgi:hypothetical protein